MGQPSPSFWNGKNVLITGITGFVGSWLAETLTTPPFNANVFGLIRRQSNPEYDNIEHLLNEERIKLIRGDIHDVGSLVNALRESKADVVFHLAAQSFVPHAFASPHDTYLTNVVGTINMLEAIKIVDKSISMHFAGSSEEYGLVIANDEHFRKSLERYKIIHPFPHFDDNGKAIPEIPIKETNPLRTVGTSPYGSSKRIAEDACRTYVSCYDLNVFITRAFNHTGPRRGKEFVTNEITRQVAEGIKKGRKELLLGNLESMRDFSDVRDIIPGYLLAVEKGEPGKPYNLGSGKGRSIEDVVHLAVQIAKDEFGLKHDLPIKQDKTRLRPTDLPLLVCDSSRAREELGWAPKISFEQTIRDMIEWQLQKL